MSAGIITLAALFGSYSFSSAPRKPITEYGLDFYRPTKSDRQLDHTNLKLFFRERELRSLKMNFKLGVAASYSSGSITQLTGSFDDGTLKSETFNSPGLGLGPVVEAQLPLTRSRSLTLDFSGAVMYYDQNFPAGGRRYNGMLEIGPSLKVSASRNSQLSVGLHWMHISNGSGLTPRNPSYEGIALSLRLRR